MSGESVDANIITLTPEIAKSEIEEKWWRHPNLHKEEQEIDRYWHWESLAIMPVDNPLYGCVAVYSLENYVEGAMFYRLDAKSELERGEICLFIDRVASAPRNRKWLCSSPLYKGIGLILLLQAIETSYRRGLKGRISLQSVPNSHTRQFYEENGFVRTNSSQPDYRLIDYELSAANARELQQKFKEI